MLHIRSLLFKLFAICAIGLFAMTASASGHHYTVEGKEIIGSEEATGTSKISFHLRFTILHVTVTLNCNKDTIAATFTIGGESRGKIEATECAIAEAPKCKVTEPVVLPFKGLLIGPEPGVEDELKATSAGEVLMEFTLTGTECVFKGKYKVVGTQICKLPAGETEVIEHEISCSSSGSKLVVGGEPATFETVENIKLVSGKKWSMH